MCVGDVSGWTTVALAVVPGALGLLGVLITAAIAGRARREELTQQRLLHGADDRLKALDAAAITAVDYRERLEAALSLVAHSQQPRLGVEPLWTWDRPDVLAFLRHDAELTLRFGREHLVLKVWRAYAWKIGEVTEFAKEERSRGSEDAERVPPEIKQQALAYRRATRKELEQFLEVASTPLEQPVGP